MLHALFHLGPTTVDGCGGGDHLPCPASDLPLRADPAQPPTWRRAAPPGRLPGRQHWAGPADGGQHGQADEATRHGEHDGGV